MGRLQVEEENKQKNGKRDKRKRRIKENQELASGMMNYSWQLEKKQKT
jgi:hypothetical protein